jgi:hypothetical protein
MFEADREVSRLLEFVGFVPETGAVELYTVGCGSQRLATLPRRLCSEDHWERTGVEAERHAERIA